MLRESACVLQKCWRGEIAGKGGVRQCAVVHARRGRHSCWEEKKRETCEKQNQVYGRRGAQVQSAASHRTTVQCLSAFCLSCPCFSWGKMLEERHAMMSIT